MMFAVMDYATEADIKSLLTGNGKWWQSEKLDKCIQKKFEKQ